MIKQRYYYRHVLPKSVRILLSRLVLVIFVVLLMCTDQALAQIKIYVVTDLEGVSGVYKFAQTREKDTPLNIQACEYFMQDLAAVVRGLRDGGATEILIIDGHGNRAMIPHKMEPGAKYLTGVSIPGGGLDKSFAGLVQFGAHSMMGTPDGVLNHTQSSKTENRYWYNGIESGELVQCAARAGYFGVPTILVTGDVATCREATHFFGPSCVTVAVKEGVAREAAVLYPFEETHKALYEGAKRSIAAISSCKPYILETPIKVKEERLNLDPNLPKPVVIATEGFAQDALHILNWEKK